MGTQLIFGLLAMLQASQEAPPSLPASAPQNEKAPVVAAETKMPARCDARPFQRLVGRTVSDLLTARVPPNTRIYRVDDPPSEAIQAGRLSVELSRNTRVRRVYCS